MQTIEQQIIRLVATDRIEIPISSLSGKLKRLKPKIAQGINLPQKTYVGERVYARVESEDLMKARGMAEGIEKFESEYPRYGTILRGMIEQERADSETHMYFGVNDGCRLTDSDYMQVMESLGFTEAGARNLYPELLDVSRKLSRKRNGERRILLK